MSAHALHVVPIAFSVAEAAELLGCSTDTVRRLIASGRLKAIQPLGKGGRVFVGRKSIERLFEESAAGISSAEAGSSPRPPLSSPTVPHQRTR
jgi:excisionase family DNA binding protein